MHSIAVYFYSSYVFWLAMRAHQNTARPLCYTVYILLVIYISTRHLDITKGSWIIKYTLIHTCTLYKVIKLWDITSRNEEGLSWFDQAPVTLLYQVTKKKLTLVCRGHPLLILSEICLGGLNKEEGLLSL